MKPKTKKTTILFATLLAMTFTILMPTSALCQTKLYKEYEHRTDLTAMCLLNHTILDTMNVDVTMLVPNSKAVALALVEEFNLEIDKQSADTLWGAEKKNTLFTTNVWKNNVKKKFKPIANLDDYKEMSILVYNYNTGTVLVFHNIDTKKRSFAISLFLMYSLKEYQILPNSDN
ncbi:MAG: hypothetical protein J6V33_02195 [Bacteroidales bacterium]|nr:hypothetical protein [Bacteroidales bacterium]